MSLFILRFWPVFLPLLVYLIWWISHRKQAQKLGHEAPRFRDGPWFWMLVVSLGIAACLFILLGLEREGTKGVYVPPHLEHGQIVPGQVQQP